MVTLYCKTDHNIWVPISIANLKWQNIVDFNNLKRPPPPYTALEPTLWPSFQYITAHLMQFVSFCGAVVRLHDLMWSISCLKSSKSGISTSEIVGLPHWFRSPSEHYLKEIFQPHLSSHPSVLGAELLSFSRSGSKWSLQVQQSWPAPWSGYENSPSAEEFGPTLPAFRQTPAVCCQS